MDTRPDQEHNVQGKLIFTPPTHKLPTLSPMRTLAIDLLELGEEILPKDFVLIFIENWLEEEVRGMDDIYQRVLPVVGIQGRAVFLHSKYMNTPVEQFFRNLRRRN